MKLHAITHRFSQCFGSFAFALPLVLALSASAQIVPTFSDSFDRADGPVGNDWQITASGNGGGGGGTAPVAVISNETLLMSRSGWGPDASLIASHLIDSSNTITTNLAVVSPAATSAGTGRVSVRASSSITNAYVFVDLLFEYDTKNFSLRIASTENGVWQGWQNTFPLSGTWTNPDELSVAIGVSGSGEVSISTLVVSTGDPLVGIPDFINSGLGDSGFDKIELIGTWSGWTSPAGATLSVMSVSAGNQIPEGKNVVAALAAVALCFCVLRKRRS